MTGKSIDALLKCSEDELAQVVCREQNTNQLDERLHEVQALFPSFLTQLKELVKIRNHPQKLLLILGTLRLFRRLGIINAV
ncbi:MAG: hypothetical protein HGB02_00245 [Chlorobiaceae bacterium]|nr:hypothetical protein [Chlorobiaceae bacterium]